MLGGHHVRAAQQHIARHAGRQRPHTGHIGHLGLRQQGGIDRPAGQQHQCIAVLGDLAGKARHIRARGFHQGAGLAEFQRRGAAKLTACLGQAQRIFVRRQRRLGDPQLFAVRAQGQPRIGHLGHQRQLRAATVGRFGEVLLQRGLAEVAHAAEQIQLELDHAEVGTELLGHRRITAAAGHLPLHADRRHAVGALDAVLRPGTLDVEHGHAQVAVVLQRLADHCLQARVDEEIAPADVGHFHRCSGHCPRGGRCRPLRGNRRGDFGAARLQRRAAGQHQAHGQRQAGHHGLTHRNLQRSCRTSCD